MKKIAIALTGIALLMLACKPAAEVTGKQRDAVLKSADPIAVNLLKAFNDGDYAAYSRDFNPTLLSALNAKKFSETRKMITGKVGKYKSHVLNRVVRKGKYDIAIYSADFEKERGVQVRVVLEKIEGRYKLAGLWFNSPKLRSK